MIRLTLTIALATSAASPAVAHAPRKVDSTACLKHWYDDEGSARRQQLPVASGQHP